MTSKFFKYEMAEHFKKLIPYSIIILVMAVITRIVQFFEVDSQVYDILITATVGLYIASVVISVIMAFATAISRFYNGMFSSEGYLTHSLPITTAGKITAKLLASVISVIALIIYSGVTVFVATFGEFAIEIVKAGIYLFKLQLHYRELTFLAIFIILIVLTIVVITAVTLLFYACISLGQRSRKNKKAAAFFMFLAFIVICFLIAIGIMIAIKVSEVAKSIFAVIYLGTFLDPSITVKVLPVLTVIVALFGALCFYVTHRSISKRLNLE